MKVMYSAKSKLANPSPKPTQAACTSLSRALVFASLTLSLFFASGLALDLQTNRAYAGCGGSSGCGGNTVIVNGQEVPVATYLATSLLEGPRLNDLQNRFQPSIDVLRRHGLHEFADQLEETFRQRNWFMLDRPVDQLGFESTQIPFHSNQAIRHIDRNVFIVEPNFNRVGETGKVPTMLMQELLEGVYQNGRNLNSNINLINLALAANFLGETLLQDPSLTTEQIRQRLQRYGFLVENFPSNRPQGSILSAAESLTQTISIPVDLAAPISIRAARGVTGYCSGGQDPRGLAAQVIQAIRPLDTPVPNGTLIRNQNATDAGGVNPSLQAETFTSAEQRLTDAAGAYGANVYSLMIINGAYYDYNRQTIDYNNRRPVDPNKLVPSNESLRFRTMQGPASFSYEPVESDPAFLRWGVVNLDRRLKSINIVIDRNIWQGTRRLQLFNSDTKVAVPIELDVDAYVNCLKDRFATVSTQAAQAAPANSGVNATETTPRAAPAPGSGGTQAPGGTGQPGR